VASIFPNGISLGRYRIVKLLGGGVSGNVYLARDNVLEVDVALKVFADEAVDTEEAWERFKREILVARRLSHPGICRVFDLHEEAATRFITMELVEGKSLEELLTDTIPPTPARMVTIVAALLDALAVAHNAGVTHRDLKPTNIVVNANGQPVILDFGFAKSRGSKDVTQAGAVVGTPAYMAPEQFRGVPASPVTDLWSVAVVLYRGLAGRPPFAGDNLLAIGDAVLNRTPEAPADISPTVEGDLSAVAMRALAKAPEDRFPTAEAFSAALRSAVAMGPRPALLEPEEPTISKIHVSMPLSAPTPVITPLLTPPLAPASDTAPGESSWPEPPTAEVTPPIVAPASEPLPSSTIVVNPVVPSAGLPVHAAAPKTASPTVFDRIDLETSDGIEHTVVQMIGQTTFSQVIRGNIAPTTILFSDIVGITNYFDKHGDIRGRKLLEAHNSLLFPAIEKCGGTVVKTIGDAIMASFPTADEAVAGAVAMQQALELYDAGAAEEERIEIRIGVHSGHAIIEKQDVFGNTVNVAARITARAAGRQILISSTTRSALKNESNAIAFHMTAKLKGKEDAFNLYRVQWREETEPQIRREQEQRRAEPTELIAAHVVPSDRSAPGPVTKGARSNIQPTRARRRRPLIFLAVLGCLVVVLLGLLVARGRLGALGWRGGASSGAVAIDTGSPASTVTELTVVPDPQEVVSGAVGDGTDTAKLPPQEPTELPSAPVAKEPTVASPSAKSMSSTTSDDRALAARKKATLYAQLGKHDEVLRTLGLIDGDSAELDATHHKIDKLIKQGRYEDAAQAVKHADQVASSIEIDKAFVSAKLVRFNKQFDRVRSKPLRKRLEPTVQMVLNALSAGSNAAANKHLNRGFAMLKAGG
jgi:serine/threonine protein kinase